MRRIGRRAKFLLLVLVYFVGCFGIFLARYWNNGKTWVTHPANQNIYQNGILKTGGSVISRDGVVLYSVTDGYSNNKTLRKATLHAIGDAGDNINTGVLRSKKAELAGFDWVNGVCSPLDTRSSVKLTLDTATCKAAYEALGNHNGTVGIYNYQTGEILCMVSKPSFDPENVPDLSKSSYEGVYVNRLTGGVYTPGSVLKLVTAAAAIERIPDISTRTFTCKGGATVGGEWVKCAGNHGTVDFSTALAHSCNAAFAQLSLELGADVLTEYANRAGITKTYFIDGVTTSQGNFQVKDASAAELAWSGIGQYTDMVNPMQYMIYMGAIANGGQAMTPYYIQSIQGAAQLPVYLHFSSKEERMLSQETAETLTELMRNNVKVEYGDGTFSDMELCAKTGTAEVEEGAPHAWFTGFLNNKDMPLAFVVVVENGGSGKGTALPVAKSALQAACRTFR